MGDDEDGAAGVRCVAQEGQDCGRVRAIEASCGLVRQNDGGFHEEGARDRHAPQFPARQLGGLGIGKVGQSHSVQQLTRTACGCLVRGVED